MRAKELLKQYAAGERNFSGAVLRGASLFGADLQGARLRDADLRGAKLVGATLTDVDLRDASLRDASLWGADLRGARLRGAMFDFAYLGGVNLCGVSLVEAHLCSADLPDADLRNADLRGAMLQGAGLQDADLSGANLSGADLRGADLSRANLSGAICESVILGTTLIDIDLGPLCRTHVRHRSFSTVDWRSVVKSLRAPRLEAFLVSTGMPVMIVNELVKSARSLDPEDQFSVMQSTFISYGGPDEQFARKLHEALQGSGVTTFFFAEHAVPGRKLHRTMRQGIAEHDRVILICSKASLDRKGVLNEIEETLARESRDGGAEYLIPIRIDDYLFDGWSPRDPGVAQTIKDRVVADFRGTEIDDARFSAQLMRLLGALKKRKP